jgi:hypothetical protein
MGHGEEPEAIPQWIARLNRSANKEMPKNHIHFWKTISTFGKLSAGPGADAAKALFWPQSAS